MSTNPRFKIDVVETFYDFEPGDLVSWEQYEFRDGAWSPCRAYGYYVGPGENKGVADRHRILDDGGHVREIPDYNDFKIEQKGPGNSEDQL